MTLFWLSIRASESALSAVILLFRKSSCDEQEESARQNGILVMSNRSFNNAEFQTIFQMQPYKSEISIGGERVGDAVDAASVAQAVPFHTQAVTIKTDMQS